MIATYQPIFLSLVTAFLFIITGRIIAIHTGNRYFYFTPFYCLITGLGAWYVWQLAGVSLAGASFKLLGTLFGVCVLILMFVMYRTVESNAKTQHTEHFWSHFIFSLLLLIPAFLMFTKDAPIHPLEQQVFMKNSIVLFEQDALYTPKMAEALDIKAANHPPGSIFINTALSFIAKTFQSAGMVIFHLILLATAAGALLHVTHIPVKWSNVLLVTVGSLLGTTVLNPFFTPEALSFAAPTFITALVLLAAATPLLTPKTLPHGWELLPNGLILALLAGLIPQGPALAGCIILLWVLRAVCEPRALGLKDIFGWVFLITLPALSTLLWHYFSLKNGFGEPNYGGVHTFWQAVSHITAHLPELVYSFPLQAVIIGGMALFFGRLVKEEFSITPTTEFLSTTSYMWVPLLLIVILLVFVPPEEALALSQFILLVPLWHGFMHLYNGSAAQGFAFHHPWLAGSVLALIFLIVQQEASPHLIHHFTPVHAEIYAKKEALKKHVPWGARVTVFGPTQESQAYSHFLEYTLSNHATAVSLNMKNFQDIDTLHTELSKNNIRTLLLTPNGRNSPIFKDHIPTKGAYLFQVEKGSFELLESYN